MTDQVSSEIWSLSITSGGIGAVAMSLDAHYRAFFEPVDTKEPLLWSDAACFYRTVATLLDALGDHGGLPLAICLSSCPTACFVDRRGQARGPIYLDSPYPMPRRDVPACFSDDPELFSIYRNSLMRRLHNISPGTDAQSLGLSTAAGCLIRALTGTHVDVSTPIGTPDAYPWAYHEHREMYFRALGVHASDSVGRVRAGHAIATVSEAEPLLDEAMPLEAWRHRLMGIPIYHTGSATASAAYATAADPLSWSCVFGWSASAHWTASGTACSAYEITVSDSSSATPDASLSEASTKDRSRDAWTCHLSTVLPLHSIYGARRHDLAYGLRTPSYRIFPVTASFAQTHDRFVSLSGIKPRFAEDLLSLAPTGSAGLHLWPGDDTIHMAGCRASHSAAHYLRATLESMAYTIKAWRDMTGVEGLGPVRALFEPPWDISCAQIISDILNTTVITPDLNFATAAAIGSAIALLRDLKIAEPDARPHLDAYEVTPSPSAVIYAAHAQIHALLSGTQT